MAERGYKIIDQQGTYFTTEVIAKRGESEIATSHPSAPDNYPVDRDGNKLSHAYFRHK
jgi:hypothetical protein